MYRGSKSQMIFGSLSKTKSSSISLGSPEAEGESTPASSVYLPDVYEDYHELIPQLNNEKFIIIGRKGAGKSAFAEYVDIMARDDANLFAKFIRGADCSLERLVQLENPHGSNLEIESLFRWLIYTNILKLFTENEAASGSKEFEPLRQFLKKNSGYIEITDYEIKELVSKSGWEINVDHLARFARAKMGKDVEVKGGRAHFSKLIPSLERVILSVFKSQYELANKNNYVLFFDDLDVGFHGSDKLSCDALVSLLRVAKKINNEIFGKNSIGAKVVLLIRDDIESFLVGRYADTAKIISTYSVKIKWFQGNLGYDYDEDSLNMKQFINARIRYAFDKNRIHINDDDPWSSLVSSDVNFEKSSFKYILNNTFFRPRDLLLFFKPLESGAYSFPLTFRQTETLSSIYSEELAKEVKNELSSFHTQEQIEMIFSALGSLGYKCTYSSAIDAINEYCIGLDPEMTLQDLFQRSVLGNFDEERGWFNFKCREQVGSSVQLSINRDHKIVLHTGIGNYIKNKY